MFAEGSADIGRVAGVEQRQGEEIPLPREASLRFLFLHRRSSKRSAIEFTPLSRTIRGRRSRTGGWKGRNARCKSVSGCYARLIAASFPYSRICARDDASSDDHDARLAARLTATRKFFPRNCVRDEEGMKIPRDESAPLSDGPLSHRRQFNLRNGYVVLALSKLRRIN